MKLMTLAQYKKMSKTALIRKITKSLRKMPKARLALLCYNLTKAKLPRLRKTKALVKKPRWAREKAEMSPKDYKSFKKFIEPKMYKRKKRKFSKKQLAAQRLFAKRAKAGTLRKRRR